MAVLPLLFGSPRYTPRRLSLFDGSQLIRCRPSPLPRTVLCKTYSGQSPSAGAVENSPNVPRLSANATPEQVLRHASKADKSISRVSKMGELFEACHK
eukprot:1177008-Prorocentrum_minimum.AAC.1